MDNYLYSCLLLSRFTAAITDLPTLCPISPVKELQTGLKI